MRKYAIIGMGAIGGYCAMKLIEAGFDVHCLLHSDFDYVKDYGFTIETDTDKTTLPIQAYQHVQDMPVCDVIIVALKTTQNSLLKEMLLPLMHQDSVVVMLQNGIGVEEEIAQFINAKQIIGGSTLLKVTKEAPGLVHYYSLNIVEFAQYYADSSQKGISSQVNNIAEDFAKTGIETKIEAHLPTLRWKKLIGNIAMNGLSVVLEASNSEMANNPASYELVCMITREAIAAAKQCGATIPTDFYEFRLQILNSFKAQNNSSSSMKGDYDAKRPLELKSIYSNAIELAKQHGAAMPLTEMLYQELVYLNATNLSSNH